MLSSPLRRALVTVLVAVSLAVPSSGAASALAAPSAGRSVPSPSPDTGTSMVTVDDFPTNGTAWSAHRGGGRAPYLWFDGSMTALRGAVAAGADVIDVDMQLTKDGVLVAMHDTTVDRTTSGTGPVNSFAYADLPPLDMRYASGEGWAPEPVPTIEHVLDEFGGDVLISIDAKSSSDIAPLTAMIRAKGLQDSTFINVKYTRGSDVQAIAAAGIAPHVWGLSTLAHVQAADAQGAFLIELPHDADPALVAAAESATSIERWIAGPIKTLSQRRAMTPGLHGYVSDALHHLERTPLDQATATSIAPQLSSRRIGPGWRTVYPSTVSRSLPLFTSTGLVLHNGTNYRRLQLGNLDGTRTASGSMTFSFVLGAATSTSASRSDFRVMLPRDEGDGTDAKSRGYVVGMRKNGQMVMWTAPVAFGPGISLGTKSTPAPGNTERVTLRFDWTPSTVTLTRLNASGGVVGTIGPVRNADWRGPDIMVSAKGPMVLTGLDVAAPPS